MSNILTYNTITVNDTVSTSKNINQTNRVMQGDPSSPILFNAAKADIVQAIKHSTEDTNILMYADDMVIASPNRKDTQHAIDALVK